MKEYLSAKQYHIKDNHPFGNFSIYIKGSEDEPDYQKKQVYNNSQVAHYYQCAFKPG